MLAMEKDFDSKLRIQSSNNSSSSSSSSPSISSSSNNNNSLGNVQRSKSFAFRAPQENFSIQDFELGKIYGVGSYSKVCISSSEAVLHWIIFPFFLWVCWLFFFLKNWRLMSCVCLLKFVIVFCCFLDS